VALRRKKDGGYDSVSGERCFTEEELGIMARWVAALIKKAEDGIAEGENAIYPAEDAKKGLACANCDFGDICGFEDGLHEPRKVESPGREERLAAMRRSLDGGYEAD
jgi:ATP-dependent helicase/DNAse subunit B